MRYNDEIYRSIFPEEIEPKEENKIESNVERIESEPIKKESNVTPVETKTEEVIDNGNNDSIGTSDGVNS